MWPLELALAPAATAMWLLGLAPAAPQASIGMRAPLLRRAELFDAGVSAVLSEVLPGGVVLDAGMARPGVSSWQPRPAVPSAA